MSIHLKTPEPIKKGPKWGIIALVVVLFTAIVGGTYYYSVNIDDEEPPTLLSKAGYQGLISGGDFGFISWEDADKKAHDEYKKNNPKAREVDVLSNVNYFHALEDITAKDVLTRMNLDANQAMVAKYVGAAGDVKKFKDEGKSYGQWITTKNTYYGGNIKVVDKPEELKIKAGEGFAVVIEKKAKAYNIGDYKSFSEAKANLLDNAGLGWYLVAGKGSTAKDYIGLNIDKIKLVYVFDPKLLSTNQSEPFKKVYSRGKLDELGKTNLKGGTMMWVLVDGAEASKEVVVDPVNPVVKMRVFIKEGNEKLTVSWSVDNPDNAAIDGFAGECYEKANSQVSVPFKTEKDIMFAEVPGLKNGVLHTCTVRALNGDTEVVKNSKEGTPTGPIQDANNVLPGMPTVRVLGGDKQITAIWVPAEETGGAPIDYFSVYCHMTGFENYYTKFTVYANPGPNLSHLPITGATGSQQYVTGGGFTGWTGYTGLTQFDGQSTGSPQKGFTGIKANMLNDGNYNAVITSLPADTNFTCKVKTHNTAGEWSPEGVNKGKTFGEQVGNQVPVEPNIPQVVPKMDLAAELTSIYVQNEYLVGTDLSIANISDINVNDYVFTLQYKKSNGTPIGPDDYMDLPTADGANSAYYTTVGNDYVEREVYDLQLGGTYDFRVKAVPKLGGEPIYSNNSQAKNIFVAFKPDVTDIKKVSVKLEGNGENAKDIFFETTGSRPQQDFETVTDILEYARSEKQRILSDQDQDPDEIAVRMGDLIDATAESFSTLYLRFEWEEAENNGSAINYYNIIYSDSTCGASDVILLNSPGASYDVDAETSRSLLNLLAGNSNVFNCPENEDGGLNVAHGELNGAMVRELNTITFKIAAENSLGRGEYSEGYVIPSDADMQELSAAYSAVRIYESHEDSPELNIVEGIEGYEDILLDAQNMGDLGQYGDLFEF